MTLRFAGDPDKLEQLAAENADVLQGISDRAQARGVIAHRFYGTDGQIMVVDEWPDAESFQQFYAAEEATIGPLMAQLGAGEPEMTFWRKLETGDEVGWN
jgi:quinol monooxygenase YgiN